MRRACAEALAALEVAAELEVQAREAARAPSWEVEDQAQARAARLEGEVEASRAVTWLTQTRGVRDAMCEAARLAAFAAGLARPLGGQAERAERRRQCDLLRDVAGNPFREVAIDPVWLRGQDGLIRKLAHAMYEEGRLADLPVLADALEEAGCSDAEILGHCRSGEEHVRGCWVVDRCRGKE
jgi:hypothetical protein